MKPVLKHLFRTLLLLGIILPVWSTFALKSAQLGSEPWSYPEGLQTVVDEALREETGFYAVAIKHLGTGEEFWYNGDTQLPSASLYKLAVLYTAFNERERGTLDFDENFVVTYEIPPTEEKEGRKVTVVSTLSVRDAIYQMITVSDNDSAELLLGRLGSATVNRTMKELGLTQTLVGVYDLAVTSPEDIQLLLEEVYTGEHLNPASRQEMLQILLEQAINDRLPRYLPNGTPVAHKTGELYDMRHDAGIVYAPNGPYVIVVMSEDLVDPDQGSEAVARLSRSVYDYFTRSNG